MKYLLPFFAVWGVIYLGFSSQQSGGYSAKDRAQMDALVSVSLDPQASALMEIWHISPDEIDKKINIFGE